MYNPIHLPARTSVEHSRPSGFDTRRPVVRSYRLGQDELSSRTDPVLTNPITVDALPLNVHDQQPRFRVWLHRAWIVTKVLAGLAATATVAAGVYLLILAVMALVALALAVIAWITAHLAQFVLGAITLIIVAILCSGGSGCGGIHCGGCRR